ncbi:hypothetical protein C0583_05010 [Candidatus Parcubacteria bacterium]|nr:MAG: hypothetical protein C0583_05010 [Candidatus Parcubacteria bacterium]
MTELVENYEIITAGENIKIKSKIEDNIFLFGNSSEIEELITNLVSNSVKYKKPNQDNIISLILSKNKNKVEVLVSDTGLGISEDDQKHLFERFFRGEKDKSVNVQGTGLGLVIVKKIVEAHNGSIEVHSKKGKGTEFKITF